MAQRIPGGGDVGEEESGHPTIVESPADKALIDKNKKDLESFFSINLSKKTQTAISVSAMALLLFVLGAYMLPFKNNLFNNFYPKPSSYATDTYSPSPTTEPTINPEKTATPSSSLKPTKKPS